MLNFEAYKEALEVLELEAWYQVRATNDYETIEIFVYPTKIIAMEVARALSINFKEVVVDVCIEAQAQNERLCKTIYTLADSDESANADAEKENEKSAEEVANLETMTGEEFATATLEEEE